MIELDKVQETYFDHITCRKRRPNVSILLLMQMRSERNCLLTNSKLNQTTHASAIEVRVENYHNFVAISELIFGLQHTVLRFCRVDNLILILSDKQHGQTRQSSQLLFTSTVVWLPCTVVHGLCKYEMVIKDLAKSC